MTKIIVWGPTDFADLPLSKPPHQLKNGAYSMADHDHPMFPEKMKERNFVKQALEDFAIKHSKYYVPNDNWLPSDFEIISTSQKGVNESAIEWAIINWVPIQEYYDMYELLENVKEYDYKIMIDRELVLVVDKTGKRID